MKEKQQVKSTKPGGKPSSKFAAKNKPAAKKPFIQVQRITSAMPAIRFPSRQSETTVEPAKPARQEPCPDDLPFAVEPPTTAGEKLPWRQYLLQRIQKGWPFFILNLVGIVSALIVGRMSMNRLFFLETEKFPIIHFETLVNESAPKIWFILNIPFLAWLTIFVASIASLVSSIILMVIFWLPKEPEDTVKIQRNWQIYSLFIQIFAFIFLIIDYFTS
jgi:hypothetical protein